MLISTPYNCGAVFWRLSKKMCCFNHHNNLRRSRFLSLFPDDITNIDKVYQQKKKAIDKFLSIYFTWKLWPSTFTSYSNFDESFARQCPLNLRIVQFFDWMSMWRQFANLFVWNMSWQQEQKKTVLFASSVELLNKYTRTATENNCKLPQLQG